MSSDVTMNNQIRSCSSYPGPQDVYGELEYSSSPPPEISIFPAVEDSCKHFEIDEHTGLPKLPVELPLPGSPEAVRSQSLRDHRKVTQLASALKMSDISSSPRKSVTFDPAAASEGGERLVS